MAPLARKKSKLPRKTVCLVIPTYNREEVLVNTLKSAFALDPKPDEILVIDQTAEHQPETTAFLKAAHGNGKIRWVKHAPPNVGGARNRSLRENRCDIIINIDDDVVMPKDFVAQHLKNYKDGRVSAVAGRIRQKDETRYGKPNTKKSWPHLLDYKYFRLNTLERVENVVNLMGANYSVTAEMMARVGGYDTNYVGQVIRDDTDFAIRIWKAGGLIVYDPEAHLLHLAAPSGGNRVKKGMKPVEWKVSFPRLYFAWCHLFPRWEFWWMLLYRDQRETVLRKYNLFRPWRIPWGFLSYWYSAVRAAFAALRRPHRVPGSGVLQGLPAGKSAGETKLAGLRKPTVCLAIPTYNREEVLVHTLQNAMALRPAPDEIMVVDQTVEHEWPTEQFLEKAHRSGRIKWIKQQPPSVPIACNRMMEETRCEVLIVVDDDVEMPKDFVANHLWNYQDGRVEAVAGKISHRARFATPHPSGRWPHVLDYKYFPLNSDHRVEGIATVMGCNFSTRLSTLRRVGGYDLNYGVNAFRFETDLAIRIWKSGGLIVFDPKAYLNHLAVPFGGTRTKKGHNPVEWKMPFARSYFAFRHLFPTWEFWWMTLFQDQRETVLRKYNLFRPWRIPWAFLSYWYAVAKAGFAAYRKTRQEKNGVKPVI